MFPSKALQDHQESESIIIVLGPTALGIIICVQVASLWFHRVALKAVFHVVCALARSSAKVNVSFYSLRDDNKRCDDMREKIDDRQTRRFTDVKETKGKRDGDASDVHFMKRHNTEYGCRRIFLERNNLQGLAPLLSRDKLTSCCTDRVFGVDLHGELELHRQYGQPLCGDVRFEKPSYLALDSIIPTTPAAPCSTSRVLVFSLREIALFKILECTTVSACGAIARSRDNTFEKRCKKHFVSEDWDVDKGEEVDDASSSSLSLEYHDLHAAQSTFSTSQASEEDERPTNEVSDIGVASDDNNNTSSPDNSRTENVSADDLNTSGSGLGAVNHSGQPPQQNTTVGRVHVECRDARKMNSSLPVVCKQRQPTPEDFVGFLGKTEKRLMMDFVKMQKSFPLTPKDCTLNISEDEELNKKKEYEEDGRKKKERSLAEFYLSETLSLHSRLAPRYPVCATVNMMRAVQGSTNHLHQQQQQQQQQQQLPLRAIHGNYENELQRLASLAYLPSLDFNLFMIPLAAAGFYFPDDEDAERVRCAFCNVAESVHSFRDKRPMDVHRELFPSCPLVLGQTSSNVTIADHAHSSGMRFLLSHQSDIRTDVQQRTRQPPASLVTPGESGRLSVISSGTTDLSVDGEASVRQLALAALPKGLADLQQTARPMSVAGSNSGPVITTALEPLGKPFSASPASSAAGRVAGGQTVADNASVPRSFSALQPQSSQPRQPVSAGRREHDPPPSTTEPSGGSSTERKVVTYEQLGIINQKPVRPDLAVAATRISTFTTSDWPHMHTHPPELMAEAGFYYTAHVDLVRCFYCKGGLKTWMATDNPWIEHARWFSKCPYVRLCKGPKFVEAVRILNDPDTVREISMESIKSEIRRMEEEERRNVEQIKPQSPVEDSKPSLMLLTPETVSAVAAEGETGAVGGEESFLETSGDDADSDRLEKLSTRLQSENEEMKGITTCKICQQRQVNVLFLPCGHLIACAQCATALRTCAVCRQPVKGAVRVQSDSNYDDDELEDQ